MYICTAGVFCNHASSTDPSSLVEWLPYQVKNEVAVEKANSVVSSYSMIHPNQSISTISRN